MASSTQLSILRQKISDRTRISRSEASWLFHNASDDELMELATNVKARFHSLDRATYLIMAIVNYTNICVAKCDYCAFYRLPHQSDTYLLSFEQICERIDRVITYGGTMVGFNGGFHPKLRIADYAKLFGQIRQRYGSSIEFYGMTVAEFIFACRVSKISLGEAASILKENGSRWITGGGAEILDDGFRARHSPGKFNVETYFQGQRAVIEGGMGSTATMVIGFDETIDERFNHLERLRLFQDSVNGALPSFLCWTYKPFHTELGGTEISTNEYLRWLAISRIFLDNFVHVRTSVLTKNEDALHGLLFGANDFDLPTEDEVTQKAGAHISLDFDRVLAAVKNLGINPVHRRPFDQTKSSRSPSWAENDSLLTDRQVKSENIPTLICN
jgi:cyclic dehypoxanthinyl futalosine synthase